MVGDSIDDMTAGKRAGAVTVLLESDANGHLVEHEYTDVCIGRLVVVAIVKRRRLIRWADWTT